MEKWNIRKNKMLPVIFALAWPTMLEQFLQTAVQYIDTAMVGSLGTQATAAVGSTSTVNWLIGSTVSAIGVGLLAFISQSFGAGNRERAKRASGQAVLVVLAVGISFTIVIAAINKQVPVWMQVDEGIRDMAARYFLILYAPMLFRTANIIFGTVLRSVGDTKTPMRVGVVMNIINTVLNFLFIYPTRVAVIAGISITLPGAGFGIEGAALASAIAYTYGGIAITVKLWKHADISPKGQSFKPDKTILIPCVRVAFPNMCQRFATSLGYVVIASMINSLGETSAAAHTIANTVESGFYIPGWGMQTAAATLAGNALGAKDGKKLRDLERAIIPLETGLMTVCGSLLFAFAPQLMTLFSRDAEVIRLGSTVLRMVAISEPFYGIPIVLEGMMQGVGKTVAPFIFSVIGMWGVRIIGTFICTQLLGMGLIAAWACMIAHNVLLFVLFAVYFARGKWKPKF